MSRPIKYIRLNLIYFFSIESSVLSQNEVSGTRDESGKTLTESNQMLCHCNVHCTARDFW